MVNPCLPQTQRLWQGIPVSLNRKYGTIRLYSGKKRRLSRFDPFFFFFCSAITHKRFLTPLGILSLIRDDTREESERSLESGGAGGGNYIARKHLVFHGTHFPVSRNENPGTALPEEVRISDYLIPCNTLYAPVCHRFMRMENNTYCDYDEMERLGARDQTRS